MAETHNNTDDGDVVVYLQKAYELLDKYVDENERLKGDAFGYKHLADGQIKNFRELENKVFDLQRENDEVRKENDEVRNKLNKHNASIAGGSNKLSKFLKAYGRELSEERKSELREKYGKMILPVNII